MWIGGSEPQLTGTFPLDPVDPLNPLACSKIVVFAKMLHPKMANLREFV